MENNMIAIEKYVCITTCKIGCNTYFFYYYMQIY